MEVVTCKNCEMTVVPAADSLCPSCGLDVSIRTTHAPTTAERLRNFRSDVRNAVWALGCVALLPACLFLWSYLANPKRVTIDQITISILVYCVVPFSMAALAGMLIGMGKRSGMALAYLTCIILLLYFPIGTIFSVWVLRKLNHATKLSDLK